jgi:hypothetical protein
LSWFSPAICYLADLKVRATSLLAGILLPAPSFATSALAGAAIRRSFWGTNVRRTPVKATPVDRPSLVTGGEGRLARRLTHFALKPHGSPRRIEHLEQAVVDHPSARVGWWITESTAKKRRGRDNALSLPRLQRGPGHP